MSTENKNYPLIKETDSNGQPLNAYDQLVTESNNFRRAVDTDINEVENKVSSLEQNVPQVIILTRDVSLTGIQSVVTPFKAKSMICTAFIPATHNASDGMWVNGTERARTNRGSDGMPTGQTSFIHFIIDASVYARGTVQNVTDTGFEINWTKGGNPTGTATIYILMT